MRTLALLGLLALASPAAAQPIYDLVFFRHAPPSVISWNGQPALLMWSQRRGICWFQGPLYSGPRVALDMQLAMIVDERQCARNAMTFIKANATWPTFHGFMPDQGGVMFSSIPKELRDLHREMSVGSTSYLFDYCPGYCEPTVCRDATGQTYPEMWAVIATVRLR